MRVERIIISLDDLPRDDVDIDGGVGLAANLRIDRAERPEDVATLAALGEGVVGCLVGHLEDGTAAVAALYLNADGFLSHASPRALDVVASARSALPSS